MKSPIQKISLILASAFLLASANTHADEAKKKAPAVVTETLPKIDLPSVFTDHMVLQRDKPIVIWGRAEKGAALKLTLGKESVSTAVSEEGDWEVTLKARAASSDPVALTVSSGGEQVVVSEILVGDVWVGSGQSNMAWSLNRTMGGKEHIAAANHSEIRFYQVPRVKANQPAWDIKAAWKPSTSASAPGFSAVLYHFGQRLQEELSVPVGLINSSWGGSPIEPWTVTESASGQMYNGMIAPLSRFPIRGCIWYQGETNVIQKNGLAYEGKMKDLIAGWRQHWGPEMPFYFVQIAPWSGAKYEAGQLPALWEAQAATLKVPHTGMVVITDLVDKISDIHPQNKKDVGARLALWALAKDYEKDVVYSGPLYKSVAIEGDAARVSFAYAAGLKSRDGKPLNEFEVAGADGKFVPAIAEVDGKTVVVRADGVKPAAVRFGWHKVANPNLVNGAGLPAAPFQSQEWTGGTGE